MKGKVSYSPKLKVLSFDDFKKYVSEHHKDDLENAEANYKALGGVIEKVEKKKD